MGMAWAGRGAAIGRLAAAMEDPDTAPVMLAHETAALASESTVDGQNPGQDLVTGPRKQIHPL